MHTQTRRQLTIAAVEDALRALNAIEMPQGAGSRLEEHTGYANQFLQRIHAKLYDGERLVKADELECEEIGVEYGIIYHKIKSDDVRQQIMDVMTAFDALQCQLELNR